MKLVPGLYEDVVTRAVHDALRANDTFAAQDEDLNQEAAPHILGRYLFDALVRALRNLPEEERLCTAATLDARVVRDVVFERIPANVIVPPAMANAIVTELRAFFVFLARAFSARNAASCARVLDGAGEAKLAEALANPLKFGPGSRARR